MRFDDLTDKRVVIWGAGREGRAAQAALRHVGIDAVIAVTDASSVPDDLDDVAAGSEALEALDAADVIIKSPGIAHTNPDYLRLVAAGVEVTGLMALWLRENADRAIGVTGTKGKSTTSAVIQHVITAAGRTASLVGNVGVPVTSDAGTVDVVVVEISSYQAADVDRSPRVAVVTSLYPEHLPWHGGYETYVADKVNMVAHGSEVVVVPDADAEVRAAVTAALSSTTTIVSPGLFGITASVTEVVWDGIGSVPAADIALRGIHNLTNCALGLAAATAYLKPSDEQKQAMLTSLRTFRPLEYRLEAVPSSDHRTWVDDSLATAPEAVVAALKTFPNDQVTLIAGGSDRGLSFETLISYLGTRDADAGVKLILVGPAGNRLAAQCSATQIEASIAPDFATALAWARAPENPSGVVLLSPGAPSFDEFASYEERSAAFRLGALGPAGVAR